MEKLYSNKSTASLVIMVLSIIGATLPMHTALAPVLDPVVNGGFETGDLTGWTGFDIQVTEGFGHTGTHSLVGIGDWGAWQSFDPPVSLPDCYLSFWYQSGTGTPIYCVVQYTTGVSDSIGPLTGAMEWQDATHTIDPTRELDKITFLTPELLGNYIAAIDDVAIICEAPPENVPPVADFTESAHTVPVGTPIDFDASGSSDPDGTIVFYEWDFETDGTYDATGMTISYTYTTVGTHTVTLRVTDNDGLTDTATGIITITTTNVQLIINGGFETGDLTGWTGSGSVVGGAYKGSYYASLYSTFVYVEQTFNPGVIATGDLTYWAAANYEPLNVTVTYSDSSTTYGGVRVTGPWMEFTLSVNHAKPIISIWFEHHPAEGLGGAIGIDDVSLLGTSGPVTYDVVVDAYCNTEAAALSVAVTMDGNPTGFNTPQTFTTLEGTHTFTVPATDASSHPFKQWSTGETSTTITVSAAGTYIAYYEATAPPSDIWSSDSLGNPKDVFTLGETVYVTVPATGQTVTLYVATDRTAWTDGDALTDVSGGAETPTLNSPPGTQTVQIWAPPLVLGSYDIVMDVNNNGVFDSGTDLIDSMLITGFNVIPEVPFGTAMTFLSMLIALVGFIGFKRYRPKIRLQ